MRRRITVLFSSSGSNTGHCLHVGRTLRAGRDLPRTWVQLSAQAALVVNSDQITQAIVWLGPRAEVPQGPWAGVQIILIVTSPHQARAYSHSVFSLSWVHLTEEPGSVSQQPFPWLLTGSFVAHQSHCVSRLRWPYFLSLSSQDKSSSSHCCSPPLSLCYLVNIFLVLWGPKQVWPSWC